MILWGLKYGLILLFERLKYFSSYYRHCLTFFLTIRLELRILGNSGVEMKCPPHHIIPGVHDINMIYPW